MRTFLARVRFAVRILTGGGPVLLTDWSAALPAHVTRWILAHAARLDPANVCEWLCGAGLCPCETSTTARAAASAG